MIREINKPNINFKIKIHDNDKFYYNEKNKEIIIKTLEKDFWFLNLNGEVHKEDGFTFFNEEFKIFPELNSFFLNHKEYNSIYFSKKTNHLNCKFCENFCKQECFF